ncbi:MAG: HDIG domain-containing metalloprotein [Planctomycetota bacterium]
MNFEAAAQLLKEHAEDDAAFVQHSHAVAGIATKLAHALRECREGVDVDTIRVRALLHDFGRSKTHGTYHGWVGYAMLRHRGLAKYGRGCITHWLRGLSLEEVLTMSGARPHFMERVFSELELPNLQIDDYIISIADFSVAHTTVVSLEAREEDLNKRYGASAWMRRNGELAREHRLQFERWTGKTLAEIVPETSRGVEYIQTPIYNKNSIIHNGRIVSNK